MTTHHQRRTALTTEFDGIPHIHGYSLIDLLSKMSFGEAIYLLLQGLRPNLDQLTIFNAVLVAAIDHGPLTPSADVARRVAAAGNPLQAAVGAGILTIGDYHGGAIEQVGQLFQTIMHDANVQPQQRANEIVGRGLAQFRRLPGYGHKIYRDEDPRVTALFAHAKAHQLSTEYLDLASTCVDALEQHKGKRLCLNIDGGMAAVLSALGFSWETFRGLFIIARTPGLVAQALEQVKREPPILRSSDTVVYDGPPQRTLE